MFKNKKEYLDQRKALVDKAQSFLDSGDAAKSNECVEEIKLLDQKFEEWKISQANLDAMKNSVSIAGTIPIGTDGVIDLGNAAHPTEVLTNESEEYRSAWIHAMKSGKGVTAREAKILSDVNSKLANVETAGEHTLLIPSTVMKGIWETAQEQHPVLADIASTNIKGGITLLKDDSAESNAEWIGEGDPVPDSDFKEVEISLTGCELAKSVTIKWKLKKMNDQEYEAYLIKKLGTKVGNAIASSVFVGKGKPSANDTFKPQARGSITALLAEAGSPRVVEFGVHASYEDITTVMSLIKSAYKAGAAWYANNTFVWTELANIVDSTGRPLFVPDVTQGGVGRLFGVPVKEEDGVPDGMCLFGNFKQGYGFNFNEEMTIYTEDHVKLLETFYMAYAIADGDVIDTEYFVLLSKNS